MKTTAFLSSNRFSGLRPAVLALALLAPVGVVLAQDAAKPAAANLALPDKDKVETAPAVKPSDEELNATYLDKPSAKATAVLEQFRAGKFDEARKAAEALAKEGDLNGSFILGICHMNGRGGPASLPEAERAYRVAADKGHAAALNNLGLLLYSTADKDKDRLADAVRTLKQAAAAAPARAALVVGELYARGSGVTAEFDEAMKYFEQAEKAGNAKGLLAQAMLLDGSFGFEKQKNEAKADELYKKAADGGQVEGMLVLGKKKLAKSKGQGKEGEEGLAWIQKAGEKGYGPAYVALGDAYVDGTLVKKDEAKAFSYYQKAADAGVPDAIAKVGVCYERGVGVAKDEKKAFEQYKAALEKGSAAAAFNLAVCYDAGTGVEKSVANAFRHYLMAAKAGLGVAMNEAAARYQAGAGVEQDVVAAAAWFGYAAKSNNVAAAINLARMYLQGMGVEKNLNAAGQLYTAAANAGDPTACYELGQLHEMGIGGSRDLIRAHALFSAAADGGVKDAGERRDAVGKQLQKDDLAKSELVRKDIPIKKDDGKKDAPAAPTGTKTPAAGTKPTPSKPK